MRGMRLRVDLGRCQGHGLCAQVAPKLFELGPDERARLLVPPGTEVPEDQVSLAEDAIAMCPEAAISRQPSEED